MAAPPTEAELTRSTTTINSLSIELLTEVLLRVRTPAALVHAAAVSRMWRGAIADSKFLASYRKRHKISPFLGLYIPHQVAGAPHFMIPDSILCPAANARDHDLKHAALKAEDYKDIERHQVHRLHDAADNAFIHSPLGLHPDCRILDCHNSRLLLTRGEEALEVRSPLTRDSILIPFPPDADPNDLEVRLLQGHGGSAAAFRLVYLEHRREGRSRQWKVRAVEYDSIRKSWKHHSWETKKGPIEGWRSVEEVMHAGHRMFCKYKGRSQAVLMLDTRKMEFSYLPLPTDVNFAIGEKEDNVCCLVESIGGPPHKLKVWQLDEKNLKWDFTKDIEIDQVLDKRVGFYSPRAISNGIALVCSSSRTCYHHFVLDLNTSSLMDTFEFPGSSAYIMQMPWPPAFSHPTDNAAGGFDQDGEPASVGDTRTGAGIEGLLGGASALVEEPAHVDPCQTRPEPSPSPFSGCCLSTDPLPLLSPESVLSTGQVPAEFAVPNPDANMAEASEGADRMHGLNQESEVDGQKQDNESPPTRRVNNAKERKKERDRARWRSLPLEQRERKRERDRARWHSMSQEQRERKRERGRAMSQEQREHKRERDRARWRSMSQEQRERKRERDRARRRAMSLEPVMNPGSSEEPLLRLRSCERGLNHDVMLQPLTLASCTQQGGKLDGSGGGKGNPESTTGRGRRPNMPNPKYLRGEWLFFDDDWC